MQDLCGSLKTRWAAANSRRSTRPFDVAIQQASVVHTLMNLRFADDIVLVAVAQ